MYNIITIYKKKICLTKRELNMNFSVSKT